MTELERIVAARLHRAGKCACRRVLTEIELIEARGMTVADFDDRIARRDALSVRHNEGASVRDAAGRDSI